MTAAAVPPDRDREPTEWGWYTQAGTSGHMIFARSRAGDWYAFTVEGWSTPCDWGYIDQAGPVVRIELP